MARDAPYTPPQPCKGWCCPARNLPPITSVTTSLPEFGKLAAFFGHPLLRLSYSSPYREHSNRKCPSQTRTAHTPSMSNVPSSVTGHIASRKTTGHADTSFPPFPTRVLPPASGTNSTPLRTHCGVPPLPYIPCQSSHYCQEESSSQAPPTFPDGSATPWPADKPYIFHSFLLSIAPSGAD